MNNGAKERLHKILNVLYYIIVSVNLILPVFLTTIGIIAILNLANSHWSVKLLSWLTLFFSSIELISQLKRFAKGSKSAKQ